MYKPENEAALADMIASAQQGLSIRGGGTRGVQSEGEALSTAALSGVELYEPGALTLVAKAGTPLTEIEALLAAENQRLAFEPMDSRGLLGTEGEPTIGGVFAANVSGPRRIQAGAARDFLLGVRFVDGQGNVIKNGGRVMKNVTGYDLVKLICGSHGTLGVLTEVSLKVLPQPECSGTLIWHGLDAAASSRLFREALKSPFDVTGAACVPGASGEGAMTVIRVEGFEQSVKYRVEQLSAQLADPAPDDTTMDPARNAQIWKAVRDVEAFHGQPGDVWRSSVKPTDMARLVADDAHRHVVDWGGGLVWSLVPEGTDLRAMLSGIDGHSTLVRGSQDTRARLGVFHPQPAPLLQLADGIRKQFDPRGILNPGLMG